jgi:membrane-associated protease RseP (regulator of RpoE activity)
MGFKGIAVSFAVALALFAGAVLYAIHRPPKSRGYSGLEFASLTPAASARTPLLNRGGALVFQVFDGSPGDKAKIKPGEVVAAINGEAVLSARQASDIVRGHAAGDRVTLTIYDVTEGEVKPENVVLVFENQPIPKKTFSVHPPRTLAKEYFYPPVPAANASWSRRILRGPTIRPLALTGLGAGACNGFAPEQWRVADHAADDSMIHVMAEEGFAHAIYEVGSLNGRSPEDFVKSFLETTFGAPTVLTPPQLRPYGFIVRDFGNRKGGAGFVLYRASGNRIALWVAAVPGGDAAWAKPLVGAVALSLHCASPGAPAPRPRDAHLLATRISTRCIQGACTETDFAASYLTVLRVGYVHNSKNQMFLVHPHGDFWQDGSEGPGFYHQIGGENEKLEPGRIN